MPIPPVSDSAPVGPTPASAVPDDAPAAPAPAPAVPESAPAAPPPLRPVSEGTPAPRTPADERAGFTLPTSALPAGMAQGPIVAVRPAASSARGLGSGEVVALVALYTAVLLVAGFVLGSGARPEWSIGSFQALLVGQLFAGAVVLALGLRWAGFAFGEACPIALPDLRLLPGLVLAGLGVGFLLGEVNRSTQALEIFREQVQPFLGQKAGAIAGGISVVLVAPIVEELVFRGLLLRGVLRRHSPVVAASVTAVVFALYHLDPWQAAAALPVGLGLAWLTIASGSIVPAILVHILMNATALVDAPLVALLGYGPLELATLMHLPPVLLLLAAAAAAVGCVLLWRMLAATRTRSAPPRGVPPAPEIIRVSVTLLAAFVLVVVASRQLRRLPSAPLPADEACYRAGIPAAVAATLFPGDTAAMPRLRLTRVAYALGLQARPRYLVLPFEPAAAAAQHRSGRLTYWTPAADGVVIVGRVRGARTIYFLLTRQGANLSGEITSSRDPRLAAGLLGDAIFVNTSCAPDPPAPPAAAADDAAGELPAFEPAATETPAAPAPPANTTTTGL